MVKFAKKLASSERQEWKGHYLEYKQLKKRLKHVIASTKDGRQETTTEQVEGFERALDSEVERVVLFFLAKQGDFANTLKKLRDEQVSIEGKDMDKMHQLADKFRGIGDELVQLLHFVELNTTGIRKILKKHDKAVHGRNIMGTYLSSRADSQASHLQQLYHDEGISAIIATVRAALSELRKAEQRLDSSDQQQSVLRRISEDEPVLKKITLARSRLQQSTRYVKSVAARALIFDDESSDEDEERATYESFRRLQESSTMSRWLNMASTFLYMANYYIVAPTSGDYAAKLGGDAALTGVIIGMTPIASLVGAVLYSWWANKSYRHPFLFAGSCLLLGNLLYGAAIRFDSIEMVIAGRILNGFGGARAINRRYIAENYSREERTQGSANFVTASALGIAAGPAIAAVLNNIPNFTVLGFDVTDETAPGWVMCFLWLLFNILMLLFFKEPTHPTHQKQERQSQDDMEKGQASPNESSSLLKRRSTASSHDRPHLRTLWRNVPVVVSLTIYVVLKLVQECLLTGSSTIAEYNFGWSTTTSGLYLAALGLLMFPTNMGVNWLSFRHDDREIMLLSEVLMAVGIAVMLNYGTYFLAQFIIGGMIIFVATNVLEDVNMSLLSKTVPKSFAKGTFNSGLLATEFGTFGRSVGDLLVSVAGLPGIAYVLNLTFVPLLVVTLLATLYTTHTYKQLDSTDDD